MGGLIIACLLINDMSRYYHTSVIHVIQFYYESQYLPIDVYKSIFSIS
jgi:hypothetical protein